MQLDKLNERLMLAANLGVIVGIIFLVIETQQNTMAVQSSTSQSLTDSSAEALFTIASDSVLADLQMRGRNSYDSLTQLEKYQYNTIERAQWIRMQNTYIQNELGVLQENIWPTYLNIICTVMQQPGTVATWPLHKELLDHGFIATAESCIE